MLWRVLFCLGLLSPALPALAGETAHQARPGDNPAALAKRYHVSLPALMARNPGLDPCRIKVGDIILIPEGNGADPAAPPVPAGPGGAPGVAAPAGPSGAPGTAVTQGSPDPAKVSGPAPMAGGPGETPAKAALAALPDEEAAGRKYVVVPGDCPASIAERFGIPLEVLARANPGLDAKRLPVGCSLTVPDAAACAPPPVAVTRPGEAASSAPLVMDFQ
jgi:LysM repeat protein